MIVYSVLIFAVLSLFLSMVAESQNYCSCAECRPWFYSVTPGRSSHCSNKFSVWTDYKVSTPPKSRAAVLERTWPKKGTVRSWNFWCSKPWLNPSISVPKPPDLQIQGFDSGLLVSHVACLHKKIFSFFLFLSKSVVRIQLS